MDLIMAIGMFSLVGLVFYLAFNAIKGSQQAAARKAMLDKFASAQDLGAFLETKGGQRFMADLSSGGGPLQSVLGSIHKGIIAIFLGMGFFPLSGAFSQPAAVSGIGIVLVCVGCGFLLSAIVTYVLSRWWGLIQGRAKPAEK
jgi:hypothetical protein